ncbi:MAG: ATP-binding protein [bacterium]|nr:ATP-binding protein [bacterium]
MVNLEALERAFLFRDLPAALLRRLAALGEERSYAPGQRIFQEGEGATHLCVIKEGRVALEMDLQIGRTEAGERRTFAAVLSPPDCFGWSAIVPPHTRTMSAVAIQATTVVAFEREALERLIADDPRAGTLLLRGLAQLVGNRLMEARSKLSFVIALVSHELKAPLAAVESYLQVILCGYAGDVPDKQREMLGRCSIRVQELIELINGLLRVSRIETGDFSAEITPTSVQVVIEKALENVSGAAQEKGVRVRVEMPSDLSLLHLAPIRIQEVFTNLLDNSVKFTPAGGEVVVLVCDQGRHIQVRVRDTGIGIPASELPRIFDEFYRGQKAQSKGLGLGLSLVKKIVEAHQGQIWVESPPPGEACGTVFAFTLPKALTGLVSTADRPPVG